MEGRWIGCGIQQIPHAWPSPGPDPSSSSSSSEEQSLSARDELEEDDAMGDARGSVNSQSGEIHEENRSRCQSLQAMFSSRGPSCMPCLHFEKTRLQEMKEMSIRDRDTRA